MIFLLVSCNNKLNKENVQDSLKLIEHRLPIKIVSLNEKFGLDVDGYAIINETKLKIHYINDTIGKTCDIGRCVFCDLARCSGPISSLIELEEAAGEKALYNISYSGLNEFNFANYKIFAVISKNYGFDEDLGVKLFFHPRQPFHISCVFELG